MSQKDDSENDIWDYKPLEKKKKTGGHVSGTVVRRRCSRNPGKKNIKRPKQAAGSGHDSIQVNTQEQETSLPSLSPANQKTNTDDPAAQGSSSEDFCPICQMPFSVLVVQSQRWHVAECLDVPRDRCKECPDGLLCCSTIPTHFRKYSHTLLAHSRANDITAVLSMSQQEGTSEETSHSRLPGLSGHVGDSVLESSQESSVSLSSCSASKCFNDSGTPPGQVKNGLLLLRSPGPEDFKKKKGWSPSPKGQRSTSASQESKAEPSAAQLKADGGGRAGEGPSIKPEPSPYDDEEISFSPLSEFPAEFEVGNGEVRKSLFTAGDKQNENSFELFGEDELLTDFVDSFVNDQLLEEPSAALSSPQLKAVTSSAPSTSLAPSQVDNSAPNTSFQSPQSVVLLRLRETLNSQIQKDSWAQSEQPESESSLLTQRSQTMAPRKGQSKAGQASGLKQQDIGVYFGLKPLPVKEKEPESRPDEVGITSSQTQAPGENPRSRRRRGSRERRNNTGTTAEPSGGAGTVGGSDAVGAAQTQGRGGRGGRGGNGRWRQGRWGRQTADGEDKPRCPFYKKIPGTKFVVDAFNYGEIEGVAAYFLTHFHSDHYGGLRKNSTLPIYCNRITGNLVKSKLKVAEEFVHILPMNSRVTVEGVGVILLEANHCPGAAMLLLFLPDGQTVLHTGDFRADPSMETYPELLNCRVQTLYLDTTYCSPQYTFPKQQEAISVAASAAFESVTLNPRTLVVCGSYSVGKEKVFLALAEVLGSKVCLSRDKYNTMCCLESEQVRRLITTDWKAAQVHVLPMMQLTFRE
ncbi:DNA cross-link repair 1A protein isoform X2 [Genypterus blacodes]|uniref:DNA cross-link repair 1A protein isoform X2 n=1 Tax=Genypterus blacodes TaxID=154954 RepID=UPI003F7617BF